MAFIRWKNCLYGVLSELTMGKTFDEEFMPTIKQMIEYLEDTKLASIGLTVNFTGKDYDFKLQQVIDRFSEDHPYCMKECDYCGYGTHSQCEQPEICHDTDLSQHWVDLD